MISKQFRLNENEVRKVLSRKKPFFSYTLVANTLPNHLWYARVAILISGKHARWSVNRNTFRRLTYTISAPHLSSVSYDIVFVVKKWISLERKNIASLQEFERDMLFLWKNILKDR